MIATPIEAEGIVETLKAFQSLEVDLRRQANGELRTAARTCALELAAELRIAAAGGPPVARRVARSVTVKNDRIPAVAIGGRRRVGMRGAPASVLVWGSEHGGRNFARPAGGAYWIAPTVARFGQSQALLAYKRAVVDLLRKYKLL